MAVLSRNSDGLWTTLDGLLAVAMLRASGWHGDYRYFSFVSEVTADPITIEWPDKGLALLPASIARMLLDRQYARTVTESEADAWNAALPVEPAADESVEPAGTGSPSPQPDGAQAGEAAGAASPVIPSATANKKGKNK